MDEVKRPQAKVGSDEEKCLIEIVKNALYYFTSGKCKSKQDAATMAIGKVGKSIDGFASIPSIVNYITELEHAHANNGEYKFSTKVTCRNNVMQAAYEYVYKEKLNQPMQITVENLCPLEADPAEGEQVECSEQPSDVRQDEQLSSSERVEIAKYAIDQHYFFLKQLTGVI